MRPRWIFAVLPMAVAACADDSGAPAPAASGASTSTSGGSGGSAASTSATSSSSAAGGNGGGGGVGAGGAGGAATGGGGSGGASTRCITSTSPGHHELPCDGGIVYDLEIPSTCPPSGCGLVVDIHGYTMTGDLEDESTNMRALGQQHGYAVIQPTAPGQPPGWDQPAHAPLVFAFIEEAIQALGIDAARVHSMGFSQGGGMTFRLWCEHADTFASISPIGAIAGCEFTGGKPSAEVDVMMVHGHTDALVSFDNVAVVERDAALAAFPFDPASTVIDMAPKHLATRWTTPSGTVLDFWEHDYEATSFILQGHCVPGGADVDGFPVGYSCADTDSFVYGELAIQFFVDHPK